MGSSHVLDLAGVIGFILGSLAFLLTYIRAAVNKSNRDIDKNTIESLNASNSALTSERDLWRERALDAEGQNKVLQNTVTAAPLIAQLTKQVAKHQADNTKWQKQTTQFQSDLIEEFKTFVEVYNGSGAK